MSSKTLRLIAGLAILSPISIIAQPPVQFDAATVKAIPRGPGDRIMRGGPGTKSPGHVTWRKAWLADLVAVAFHAKPENVSGPDWVSRNGAQLYSFEATFPAETTQHDFDLMFQRFLTDQFALKLRYEAKPFPAYALRQGATPAKLKPSTDPDAPELPKFYGEAGPDGFPVMPPGHGDGISLVSGGLHARFQNYTMAEFARLLTNFVAPNDEPTHYVTDETGLTGPYDFTLKFAPPGSAVAVGPAVMAAPGDSGASTEPAGAPNVIKAVEQQLGLRLLKTKDILMNTIVIDEAQKMPRGN